MEQPSSRRSFLRNVGLGSLGAVAASGMLARPRPRGPAKRFSAPPARPLRRAPRASGSRFPTGKSAWASSATASASSARRSASRTIPTSPWRRSATCFPIAAQALAKACRCGKTYPSLEEMVKDDTIEAVFVATDAPSHARHCHRRAQARQARGLGGAGRLRLAGGRRQAVGGGHVQRPEVHDVRDVRVPRRLPRHAADLPGRRVRQARLHAKGNTSTTCPRRSPRITSGASGCRRNGIPRTPTPTTCA